MGNQANEVWKVLPVSKHGHEEERPIEEDQRKYPEDFKASLSQKNDEY